MAKLAFSSLSSFGYLGLISAIGLLFRIPGDTKFLREFNFADWHFLCFAGTNFCDWKRLIFLPEN